MKFHVVTPSFNQLSFLRRLVASVADQATTAVSVHHHVQDGGSTDGTVEFLEEYFAHQQPTDNYQLTFASEADDGMYDAINKGWLLAADDVDIIAHMNCDEQYLPGGLEKVANWFGDHPAADVVLADMIVTNKDGDYICHRRSLKPNAFLSRICCIAMTTTTFHRVSVVREKKVLFDTSWRDQGDMVWYNCLHKSGVRFSVFNEVVSLFVDTGENMNLQEWSQQERKRYADEYLFGLRKITRLASKFYSLRRYLKEFYLKPPQSYALYWDSLSKREFRPVDKPTGLWHRQVTLPVKNTENI
jgi:glycosyltransferase involved in cell wall biosynthesis